MRQYQVDCRPLTYSMSLFEVQNRNPSVSHTSKVIPMKKICCPNFSTSDVFVVAEVEIRPAVVENMDQLMYHGSFD